MEDKLQGLIAVAHNPAVAITKWKSESNGKVIGSLPIYLPEEIIDAAGALPVYLWGGKTEIERANAHLQGFSCSIVRAVLEYGLKGSFHMVDGFVFPSTCDHIQNTSDIWSKVFPEIAKFDLVYPANRQSKGAATYLVELYQEFQQWLEKLTGASITEERLVDSIRVYNHHRELLYRLRLLRAKRPESLTGREMASLVKVGLFIPKREYNAKLEELLPWLETRTAKARPQARLVLTGILAEPEEILEIIEQLGGGVVADDLALGARLHRQKVQETGNALESLAQRHLQLGPCSTLFDERKPRGAFLRRLVDETQADAVVFINMKFCEVEEFDYPVLKKEMDEAGIPLLFLEVEQQMSSFGQIRTRLQAFMEMLV